MRKIALMGEARIQWTRLRGRAAAAVHRAVKNGELPNLKKSIVPCKDCGSRAKVYDHRDYNKPLEVSPVCAGCNVMRGTNAPILINESNRPSCPKCKSTQVLYRVKKQSSICRVCGFEFKKESKKQIVSK